MKHKKDIKDEVERTMRSLDGLERAKTDPYFFTRLEARMERDSFGTLLKSLWGEPRFALAAAAVVLIVLFNIFSVAEYQQYYQTESIQQTQEIAMLAEEYELNIPVIYDTNEDDNGY